MVNDTSIKLVSKKSLEDLSDINTIHVKDISKIYIKRRRKSWRGTIEGFLGTTVAVELILAGNDEGSYIPNEITTITLGVFFGVPIGALVGTGKKKFRINGDETVFKTKYKELNKYAMVKSPNKI